MKKQKIIIVAFLIAIILTANILLFYINSNNNLILNNAGKITNQYTKNQLSKDNIFEPSPENLAKVLSSQTMLKESKVNLTQNITKEELETNCNTDVKLVGDTEQFQAELKAINLNCVLWLKPLKYKLSSIILDTNDNTNNDRGGFELAQYNAQNNTITVHLKKVTAGAEEASAPESLLSDINGNNTQLTVTGEVVANKGQINSVFLHELGHFIQYQHMSQINNLKYNNFLFDLSEETLGKDFFDLMKGRCFGLRSYEKSYETDDTSRSLLAQKGFRAYTFANFSSDDIPDYKILRIGLDFLQLSIYERNLNEYNSKIDFYNSENGLERVRNNPKEEKALKMYEESLKDYTELKENTLRQIERIKKTILDYNKTCENAYWKVGSELLSVGMEILPLATNQPFVEGIGYSTQKFGVVEKVFDSKNAIQQKKRLLKIYSRLVDNGYFESPEFYQKLESVYNEMDLDRNNIDWAKIESLL